MLPAASVAARLAAVPLRFTDGDNAVCAIDTRGGVLWCFGYRSLAAFDGQIWQHFEHPDNIRRKVQVGGASSLREFPLISFLPEFTLRLGLRLKNTKVDF